MIITYALLQMLLLLCFGVLIKELFFNGPMQLLAWLYAWERDYLIAHDQWLMISINSPLLFGFLYLSKPVQTLLLQSNGFRKALPDEVSASIYSHGGTADSAKRSIRSMMLVDSPLLTCQGLSSGVAAVSKGFLQLSEDEQQLRLYLAQQCILNGASARMLFTLGLSKPFTWMLQLLSTLLTFLAGITRFFILKLLLFWPLMLLQQLMKLAQELNVYWMQKLNLYEWQQLDAMVVKNGQQATLIELIQNDMIFKSAQSIYGFMLPQSTDLQKKRLQRLSAALQSDELSNSVTAASSS